MILGALTVFHVLLAATAIFSGFIVINGFLCCRCTEGWNVLFLTTAIGTSATGFLFPFHGFVPADTIGILSLIVLIIAVIARHFGLAGAWRATYVVTTVVALYFNMVVLVAEFFRRLPPLRALAPTQTEPLFQAVQVVLLLVFVVLAVKAVYGMNIRRAEAN